MDNRDQFDEFITAVLAKVRFTEAHEEIRRELKCHLDEAMEQGVGEAQVIRQMGSPAELGQKLDEVHQPKTDWVLIAMVSALVSAGLYSQSITGWLSSQLLWTGLGLIPLVGLIFVKPADLRRWSWTIYGISAALMVTAFVFGPWYEGQPYLAMGPLRIKIIDFSVVFFAIALAGPLSERSPRKGSVWALFAAFLPLIAYLKIGSIYPAALLYFACIAILVAAKRSALVAVTFAAAGGVLLAALSPKAGFHGAAAVHTDFILRFMETSASGVARAAMIMGVSLVAYLASVASSAKNAHARALVAAAFAILGGGVLFGGLANFGWIPMPATGINVPFLSYGGSMLVGHMAMIGLVLGVQRRRNLHVL